MRKSVFLVLATGLIVFVSCKKENDPKPAISVSEAKSMVSNSSSEVKTIHDEFNNSDAMKATTIINNYNYLGDYSPGMPTEISSVSRKAKESTFAKSKLGIELKKRLPSTYGRLLVDVIDNDFTSAKGVYEYNFTTLGFDKTSSDGDAVVVKFPYPSTNTENNAIYTVSKFETISVNGMIKVTSCEANLKLNGSLIMSINGAMSYNEYGDVATANLSYVFGEKAITATLNNTTNVVSASINYTKNGSVVLGYSASISYKDATKSDFGSISFNYILGNLTWKGNLNTDGLINDPGFQTADTQEKVNALIDKYFPMTLNRSSDDAKIGDVKIRTSNSKSNLVIFYSDGSQGDFEPVLQALVNAGIDDVTALYNN